MGIFFFYVTYNFSAFVIMALNILMSFVAVKNFCIFAISPKSCSAIYSIKQAR